MPSIDKATICEKECGCGEAVYTGNTRFIVLTGGPGAGKTAVLEIARKELCRHVVILPEAASIAFGGGFWRLESPTARKASQRVILHIQQQMERLVTEEKKWPLALCDRGTLDGLAYWDGDESEFWLEAGTTLEAEYARYAAVIHLRTPTEDQGYNHLNPLRIESAIQAAEIDQKIHKIWSRHPHYKIVESTPDFLIKVRTALHFIMEDMPTCCAAFLKKGAL